MAHIHSAAKRGDFDAVAQELASGVDADAVSIRGSYPLTLAAYANHQDVVELLLKSGADPTIRDDTGRTALHYAASNGSVEVLSALLNAGADPNCVDEHGRTPLHIAAARGFLQIARALLQSRSQLETVCRKGRTPLVEAIVNEQHEMAALLRSAGAAEAAYRGAVSWLGPNSERLNSTDRIELAIRELRIMGVRPHQIDEMLTPDRKAKLQTGWAEFISDMEAGDELWWFTSPKEEWAYFAGCAGYALVRKGRPFKRKIVWKN